MRHFRILFVGILAIAPFASGNAQASANVGLDQATVSDTLHYSVPAGEALILSLPESHGGNQATYSLVKAPALSWMVDRSFFWQTTAGERGRLPILVERRAGSSRDTLVVLVHIQG